MAITAAERHPGPEDEDPGAALTLTLARLESRPMADLRADPESIAEAHRTAVELGDDGAAQQALLLQADVMLREGRLGEGGRVAHQARAWAAQHDNPDVLARAHRVLSFFHRMVGDLPVALTHGVQCVDHLPQHAPPDLRAQHLMALAVTLDDNGRFEDSARYYREALEIAARTGDEALTLRALNNMAYNALDVGDEPAATDLTRQMRAASRQSGHPLTAKQLDTVARVEMLAGRYDSVERTLAGVVAGDVLDHDGDGAAECLLTLAEARRLAGRHADAQSVLDRAVEMCERNGLTRLRAVGRQEQAALYAAAGLYQQAYEEHRLFCAAATALHSAQQQARAFALQAIFEASEARRASDHFREMAHRDALTGLYNRRYVDEHLPTLLDEAAARRTPLSAAIVDLDHFKRINDTLSHATGDAVLQQVGRLLQDAASGTAVAARMGGEEFLLIFPGVGAAEAARRCEMLRLALRTHAWAALTGHRPVTASIGVTTTDGGTTMAALLARADERLYAAKQGGRDRMVAADLAA